jgi:hypothetical protein
VSLLQNSEMLPKRQIFQEEVAARATGSKCQDKQELQRTEHKPVLAESRSDLLPHKKQARFFTVVDFVAVAKKTGILESHCCPHSFEGGA